MTKLTGDASPSQGGVHPLHPFPRSAPVLQFNRLPDKFVWQGVNKEFKGVKFPQLPPNHSKFSINLLGH